MGSDGSSSLPSRPGRAACAHYMKSGICRFGANCNFDHPKWDSDGEKGGNFGKACGKGKALMGKWSEMLAAKGKGPWARTNNTPSPPEGSVLRLTNVPDSVTDESIYNFFEGFSLVQVIIGTNLHGKPNGEA